MLVKELVATIINFKDVEKDLQEFLMVEVLDKTIEQRSQLYSKVDEILDAEGLGQYKLEMVYYKKEFLTTKSILQANRILSGLFRDNININYEHDYKKEIKNIFICNGSTLKLDINQKGLYEKLLVKIAKALTFEYKNVYISNIFLSSSKFTYDPDMMFQATKSNIFVCNEHYTLKITLNVSPNYNWSHFYSDDKHEMIFKMEEATKQDVKYKTFDIGLTDFQYIEETPHNYKVIKQGNYLNKGE